MEQTQRDTHGQEQVLEALTREEGRTIAQSARVSSVTPRLRTVLTLAVPLGLALLAYAPVWSAGFAFDDPVAISSNPVVNGEVSWTEAFARNFWGDQPRYSHMRSWRPLTLLSLRVDHVLGGGSALWFHAVNLLWLFGFVAVIWWTARRCRLSDTQVALLTTFIALTTANSEAVASIVGRGDLLGVTLAALGSALLLTSEGSRKQHAWGVGLLGLALLAKETSVMVVGPLLVIVLLQRRWWTSGAIALVGVLWFVCRTIALEGAHGAFRVVDNPLLEASFGEHVVAATGIVGRYVSWSLAGLPPAADYSSAVELGAMPYPLVGVLTVGLLAWLGWRGRTSMKTLFGVLLAASCVALLSNLLITLPAPMAGRYGPWWVLAIAWLVFGLAATTTLPRWALGLATVVAIGGAPGTFLVADAWQSDRALFTHSTDVEPNSARAWTNLGAALSRETKTDRARKAYQRALRIVPDYYEALHRLADLELTQGKNPQVAWRLGQAALKAATTGKRPALQALCEIQMQGGGPRTHPSRILANCERATRDDTTPRARLLVARALQLAGRVNDAGQAFESLMKDHPTFENGKGHFIGYLGRIGEIDRAIALQREMLAAKPHDDVPKRNLVALLFMRADRELMAKLFDKACQTAREAEKLVPAQQVKERVFKLCGPR